MSDISGIDSRIVDMYLKGYSIKSIVDYVFKYSNRNVPKNYSFGNSFVVNKKNIVALTVICMFLGLFLIIIDIVII